MKNKKKLLTDIQKENLEISKKSINIVKHICNTKEGLSQKDLENIGNLVKKSNDNNNSKEFNEYIKKEAIDIIDISLNKNKKQQFPENLMNELSKEVQGTEQKTILNILDKVSDNQKLTKEASNNLVKLLNDDNLSTNKNNDDDKYNISLKIL